MFRTNANTIMGERACTALELFRRGCATMRRTPAEMSSSEKIYGISSTTKEAYRESVPDAGKPTRTALQHFSLELKEHVKGMCHSTNGLDGLDVGFFLHENRVLRSDSDVVGDQVHSLKKRAPWDSCTTPLLSSPILSSCTPSRSLRCL